MTSPQPSSQAISGAAISAPCSGCRRITSHSWDVGLPSLLSSSGDTSSLPMSCSNAAQRSRSRSRWGSAIRSAMRSVSERTRSACPRVLRSCFASAPTSASTRSAACWTDSFCGEASSCRSARVLPARRDSWGRDRAVSGKTRASSSSTARGRSRPSGRCASARAIQLAAQMPTYQTATAVPCGRGTSLASTTMQVSETAKGISSATTRMSRPAIGWLRHRSGRSSSRCDDNDAPRASKNRERNIGRRSGRLNRDRRKWSKGTGTNGSTGRPWLDSRMPVLPDRVDRDAPEFASRRESLLQQLSEIEAQLAIARGGGGEKYVERHRKRGKLLARERVELLLDPDSPFLELSPLAAWGTTYPVGASVVTGIGVVEGTEVLINANDPTVRGGATNPWTARKSGRAAQIAEENRLPVVNLVESGGADLPTQSEIFIPGGRGFRDLTRKSAAKIPTIALVFGNSTAGGAYIPGMCDYVVMVKERAKVFLGGPPLVKMATGEESDDEELGGAEMHARVSGLADYLAADEADAIRLGRQIVRRLNRRKLGGAPAPAYDEPRYDADDLLGMIPTDLREPFDPRDVLARLLDGSEFDEFKPLYGSSLVTGWGSIHGYPIGVLANARGVLFAEESEKAAQFIQLANQSDTPLLFLQNTTGYMVGKEYEQRGIIKAGAQMINAVSNSAVPHLTVVLGASYGAGNYGMCGRAYDPRFLFTWPNAKSAVMGPAQLAGVLSIVARQSALARGQDSDETQDAQMRELVENQIEAESKALFLTARVYDDGIIDPRDTRTVLGLSLSVIHNQPVEGRRGFGVFRM